jgi:hypothetical protein
MTPADLAAIKAAHAEVKAYGGPFGWRIYGRELVRGIGAPEVDALVAEAERLQGILHERLCADVGEAVFGKEARLEAEVERLRAACKSVLPHFREQCGECNTAKCDCPGAVLDRALRGEG